MSHPHYARLARRAARPLETLPCPAPHPVAQPRAAIQQTAPRPAWSSPHAAEKEQAPRSLATVHPIRTVSVTRKQAHDAIDALRNTAMSEVQMAAYRQARRLLAFERVDDRPLDAAVARELMGLLEMLVPARRDPRIAQARLIRMGGAILVSSATREGVFYEVRDGQCPCEARGECWHLRCLAVRGGEVR